MTKELFRRNVGEPAKQNHHQRHQRIFAPRRDRFFLFFRCRCGFWRSLRLSRNLDRWRRPGDFTLTNHRDTANNHVVKIDGDIAVFLFAQQFEQVDEVGAVKLGRLRWQTARQVGIADNLHPVLGGCHLIRHGIFAVTAVLRGKIDNYAARFHRIDHFTGDQFRGRFARDQRSGNDNVDVFRLCSEEFHFGFDERLGHHFGIAIAAARFFFKIQFKELGAHTLHLLLHFRTGIKSTHDSAQAVCRTDRRKTCHTRTNHHDLGRWNLACGGDLAGEEATEFMCSFNNSAIPGDVRH